MMARSADSIKRQVWRERLRRFERSRSTVAAFCQAEGVSVPSFYQWRRTLGRAARGPEIPARQPFAVARQPFVPVDVVAPATIDIHLPNGARLTLPASDWPALEARCVDDVVQFHL